MFSSEKTLLGKDWEGLVRVWAAFEMKRGMENKGKGFATTAGRPPVVHDWVQRARKPTWRPAISAPGKSIADGFSTWWGANQPEWRAEGGRDAEDGCDWSAVNVHGPNGISTVMAVLFFWGIEEKTREDSASIARWKDALSDVSFVLDALLKFNA